MNILITSARAPVAAEWARLLKSEKNQIFVCDSLYFPISKFTPNVKYLRHENIKNNFEAYSISIKKYISKFDFIIPTCEDIFWLAKLPLNDNERKKCLMPPVEILLQLHNKFSFFNLLPECENIGIVKTKLIKDKSEIDYSKEKSILKPVYSRFGQKIIRDVNPQTCKNLEISATIAWVQQKFIQGENYCNFLIAQNGNLIAHSAYRPKWLINNAAASYFEPIYDKRIENFAQKFCKKLNFTGQAAFDFIDDGKKLWVIECNPRSTSGLHLFSGRIELSKQGELSYLGQRKTQSLRVGYSLPLLFSLNAIKNKKFKKLWHDFYNSQDVLNHLPFYAPILSFSELIIKACYNKQSLSAASTADIEYNG
ncbi:MAG: ATP-grasp domain-containing protein [Campylobacter sp.]|nr:ATP-grasp domain-containing protein [Campylobacter sp.]